MFMCSFLSPLILSSLQKTELPKGVCDSCFDRERTGKLVQQNRSSKATGVGSDVGMFLGLAQWRYLRTKEYLGSCSL